VIELLLEAERALSFGRIDRAEELYRQVADADPRNSIAVVGLARVTLERGDELGAYLLARRALTVDPENTAARRLAIRLEEVLRTRGDAVPDAGPMPPEPPKQRSEVPGTHAGPRAGSTSEAAAESRAGGHPSTPAGRRRSLLDRLRGR
jgi:tetratricopeptide (TPR) repeat protein